MIDPKNKEWIDNATYETLLSKWRFAPVGDPLFMGETGEYYGNIMAKKKKEIGQAGHVAASKNIGWEK